MGILESAKQLDADAALLPGRTGGQTFYGSDTVGEFLKLRANSVDDKGIQVNVDGSIKINDIYSFPNVDGTLNQVLKTNGSGAVTWQDDATLTPVAPQQEEFTATAGQTSFTILGITPTFPSKAILVVNRIVYNYSTDAGSTNDFSISGNTITWYTNNYTMQLNDNVQIFYDGSSAIGVIGSDDVANESSLPGVTVTNVFDNILSALTVEEKIFELDYANDYLDYRTKDTSATGNFNYSFKIPSDFVSLNSLIMRITVAAGAAGSGKDIDFFSTYATAGEPTNTHTESDTSQTFDFTGEADRWIDIDISGVYTNIAACDSCGFRWDNNAIGASTRHIEIMINYNRI